MLASLGKAFLIQLFWVVTAQAGPLEQLSKGAFLAAGNRCQSYNEKSAQKGVQSLCVNDTSAEHALGDLSRFFDDEAEDQLFVNLAKQQVTELGCAEDFAKAIASPTVEPQRLENIQAKLDLARLFKQNLVKASQKLASDPDVSARSCPLDMNALESETPKELKTSKTYALCKEIITNRQAYFAAVSAIPLSGVSDVQSYIEKYVNTKEETQQKGALQQAYSQAVNTLRRGAKKLSDSVNKRGAKALGRSDRHALLQDPAVAEQVISQIPVERREDVRGLLCQADARYGKGADNLDGGLMVISLGFSGGVGVWVKTGAYAKAAFLAEQGRRAGVVSNSSMRTIWALQGAAAGTDVLAAVIAVDRACEDKMVPDLKTGGACTSAPSVEKIEQENCVLMSTLSAMGFASVVPDKLWKAIGTKIPDKLAAAVSKIKNVSNAEDPQSIIWAAKARGDLAEAKRLEKELTSILSDKKIVAARPIGHGISRPYYVKFEDGTEGVWKSNENSALGGVQEIAAYKVDQELGTDFVPVTVSRSLNGVPGTVQVRVTKLKKQPMPDSPDELALFDYLIANTDRHSGNFLQTQSGRIVAIDHGWSFGVPRNGAILHFNHKVDRLRMKIADRKKLEDELVQAKSKTDSLAEAQELEKKIKKLRLQESQLQSDIAIAMPEKKVIDQLRQTTLARWQRVLGEELTERQVNDLYARQTILLQTIDEAEKLIGPQRLYREGPVSPLMSSQPPQSGFPFGNIQIFGRPK